LARAGAMRRPRRPIVRSWRFMVKLMVLVVELVWLLVVVDGRLEVWLSVEEERRKSRAASVLYTVPVYRARSSR
jgi:hypothetical protein